MENLPSHVIEDLQNTIDEYDKDLINARDYEGQVRKTLKPYAKGCSFLKDWGAICLLISGINPTQHGRFFDARRGERGGIIITTTCGHNNHISALHRMQEVEGPF